MTTTLEIKVWVKGGQDTRSPDYYIKVDDSEYGGNRLATLRPQIIHTRRSRYLRTGLVGNRNGQGADATGAQ